MHVWSNVSLSALVSVVNLLRVRSPSVAAWLTCPRWSRHRTSLRCLLWCQTNNTTGEGRPEEPRKTNKTQNNTLKGEVKGTWKRVDTLWQTSHFENVDIVVLNLSILLQCFDSITLDVVAVVGKFCFWSRNQDYVWNLPSIIFNYTKSGISKKQTADTCLQVWRIIAPHGYFLGTLCGVYAIMSLQCVCPCLWCLLGHVEWPPLPLRGPGSWAKG